MRPTLVIFALLSSSCTTGGESFPANSYAGTAVFSCGVTDGPASRLELASSDGKISIFVHDFSPESLSGSVPIKPGYYSESSAKLEYCPAHSAPCLTSADGSITISRNTKRMIYGSIHFSSDGTDWQDVTFAAKVIEPPAFTICG
jgi:hypothetical protein